MHNVIMGFIIIFFFYVISNKIKVCYIANVYIENKSLTKKKQSFCIYRNYIPSNVIIHTKMLIQVSLRLKKKTLKDFPVSLQHFATSHRIIIIFL